MLPGGELLTLYSGEIFQTDSKTGTALERQAKRFIALNLGLPATKALGPVGHFENTRGYALSLIVGRDFTPSDTTEPRVVIRNADEYLENETFNRDPINVAFVKNALTLQARVR